MGRAKAFPARSFSSGSRPFFRRALKAGAAFLPFFRRFAARCMIGYLTPGVRLSAGKRGREGKALPHCMTPVAESSGVRRFGCKLRVSMSFGPAHAGRLRPGIAGPSCQRKGLQEQGSVVPGAWASFCLCSNITLFQRPCPAGGTTELFVHASPVCAFLHERHASRP